jgi:hypothetical protein
MKKTVQLDEDVWLQLVQLKYEYRVRSISEALRQLLQNHKTTQPRQTTSPTPAPQATTQPSRATKEQIPAEEDVGKATEKQISYIKSFLTRWKTDWHVVRALLRHELDTDFPEKLEDLQKNDASIVIDYLKDWDQPASKEEVSQLSEDAKKLLEKIAEPRKIHILLAKLASQPQ